VHILAKSGGNLGIHFLFLDQTQAYKKANVNTTFRCVVTLIVKSSVYTMRYYSITLYLVTCLLKEGRKG